MHTKINPQKTAVLIAAALLLLTAVSLAVILFPRQPADGYIADVYQDGSLIASIALHEVTETYSFTVAGEDGCINEITVRPGSIGITAADCPDRLCVQQGFISDAVLPVTCLPNRVVIRLRPDDSSGSSNSITPDIISY